MKFVSFILLLLLFIPYGISGQVTDSLLQPRERMEPQNQVLMERFQKLLPRLMKESGIDCWLIICREYNEDPVFFTLMPAGTLSARRLTMLAFFSNENGQVDRLSISPYDIGGFYRGVWNKEKEGQWEALIRLISERKPTRIGVNRSHDYAHADGLSAQLEKGLLDQMPDDQKSKVVNAEPLCVRWLETRLPSEEKIFKQVVSYTRALIARAFSAEQIQPGVTTVSDLQWWMRSEMDKEGVVPWFFPHVDRKSRHDSDLSASGVILAGDFLHCDVGVIYMGLCSDIQELAYVCRRGESDVPEQLKAGMKAANDFQDLVSSELILGCTGNEILKASLKRAAKEELDGVSLYSHPLGVHGHAAGPTIGMWDNQNGLPGHGDWRLYPDTAYALELNVTQTVPGWAGQVRFGLEQDIWVSETGTRYIAGRQIQYHVIKFE